MKHTSVTNQCVVCASKDLEILFQRQERQAYQQSLQTTLMEKCRTCGLVQVVPMPTKKEIAKLYHEDFDHFAPYIEQIDVHREYFRDVLSRRVIPGFRPLRLSISSGGQVTRDPSSKQKLDSSFPHRSAGRAPAGMTRKKKLLDIGCAMGALLVEAEKAGFRAEGIDLSHDAVDYCRKYKHTVYHGTVYSVKELKQHSYDVVTAFQIIEHERDPLRFVMRIYKLLKNGGMAIFATPNYGGWWRKIMGSRWVGFTHPEHVILLDTHSLRYLLKSAGFRDIEIYKDTPRPFPLSFAFCRAADYFPMFSGILKPLGKLFDRFHLINPINPWDDMIAFAKK